MNNQLKAELCKLRTTRTTLGVGAAMVGLIALAVALHTLGLSAEDMAKGSRQLGVMVDVGAGLGGVFAALIGALSITAEIRHGTIRPTFLVTPRRARVVAAKAVTTTVTGCVFGLVATAVAAVAGTAFLTARGLTVHVTAGDYALLLAGGAVASALWAVIGFGVGAVVRAQVPTVVGLLVWMLFVENTLAQGVPAVAKFAPGALGKALAGGTFEHLASPAIGAILLAAYAGAAFIAGRQATTVRDFA